MVTHWNSCFFDECRKGIGQGGTVYGSTRATLCDSVQSRYRDSLRRREGVTAIDFGQIEVEFLDFAEQGALVHSQFSGGGQAIVASCAAEFSF